MQVSKEQLLHIAELSNIDLKEEEINSYLENLQEILTFAEKVNSIPTDGLDETIGANDKYNVFRKDEIVEFEDKEALLQNAPSKNRGMFSIPKVIQ